MANAIYRPAVGRPISGHGHESFVPVIGSISLFKRQEQAGITKDAAVGRAGVVIQDVGTFARLNGCPGDVCQLFQGINFARDLDVRVRLLKVGDYRFNNRLGVIATYLIPIQDFHRVLGITAA